MKNINIKQININDTQDTIISKLNDNFDSIIQFNGGLYNTVGPTGPTGCVGIMGAPGATGVTGARGTKWIISSIHPTGNLHQGDYWIDSVTNKINELTISGWVDTGFTMKPDGKSFIKTDAVYTTYQGYNIRLDNDGGLPKNNLFILSDDSPESGINNETLGKFVISTDSEVNDAPLIEFGRNDVADIGDIKDYSAHPVIYWLSKEKEDLGLGINIPNNKFYIGTSGGFKSDSKKIELSSQKNIDLIYGINSSSGIYATGGYNIKSKEFNLTSKYININNASTTFASTLVSESTLSSETPILKVTASGTGGVKSIRTGDTYNTLSPIRYHLLLEDNSGIKLSLATNGTLKTNKIKEGISYSSQNPNYTKSLAKWYFITRTSTPYSTYPSTPLENGNTIIIATNANSGADLGIGIDTSSDYGWGASGGLNPGESLDIKVLNTSNSNSNISGFKYIGIGSCTGGTGGNGAKVALPFLANSIDFTLSKNVNSTTVYWKAYSSWNATTGSTGGSGGSFTF